MALRKCGINGFHSSSPNRPHLSAGIQKISPLLSCFFIGSENLCSKDGGCCRYLGRSEMFNDACVLQTFTAAEHRPSTFLELKRKEKQTNRRTLKSFVARWQGHSSLLSNYQCSWSHTAPSVCTLAQLLLCASRSSAWSHHQDLMEKFCHVWSFFSKLMFQSFYAKLEIRLSECFKQALLLQVVLIRDPSQFLLFSSCHWTSTSVRFFLTLPGFQ